MLMGLHLSAGNVDRLTTFETTTRDVLAPVQRLVMIVGQGISNFVSYPVNLIKVSQRNLQLEERVAELEGKLSHYDEVQAENNRLKEQLNFKTSLASQLNTEAAAIISRSTGNWFGSVIINKGSKNGIEPDMAVITKSGLVGRVANVSDNTAEVLLITDPRSGVGCLVQESRAHGIVEGVAGGRDTLHMVNVPTDQAPDKGDKIITSGFGSVYPKGIPVGAVLETRREQSGLFKMAILKPYVDFNRLEEVFVIKLANLGNEDNSPR